MSSCDADNDMSLTTLGHFCSDPIDGWAEPLNDNTTAHGSSSGSLLGSYDSGNMDVEMDTPSTSPEASREASLEAETEDSILIISRERVSFECARTSVELHSSHLFGMIDGQGRIELPLPYDEVKLITDTINGSIYLDTDYWTCCGLLVRTVQIYEHYGFDDWDIERFENAMVDCLKPGDGLKPDDDSCMSRFDLKDRRSVRSLLRIAVAHNMTKVLALIEREAPQAIQVDDSGRARKRRKISHQ